LNATGCSTERTLITPHFLGIQLQELRASIMRAIPVGSNGLAELQANVDGLMAALAEKDAEVSGEGGLVQTFMCT
jgi:hypothetical protein